MTLYNDLRPRRFDGVVGQPDLRALRARVAAGTIAHSLLFAGPPGSGKTSTARILYAALNCTEPQAGEPCGHCETCTDTPGCFNWSLTELDAASNNGVDAIRELNSKIALRSGRPARVIVLDEAHMLTTAAQNALLKSLEEPPAGVYWVLCTTAPDSLLATIRSRCTRYGFRPVPEADIVSVLQTAVVHAGLDIDEATVSSIAQRCGGGVRDALSMLENPAEVELEERFCATVLEALTTAESETGQRLIIEAVAAGRGALDFTRALGAAFDLAHSKLRANFDSGGDPHQRRRLVGAVETLGAAMDTRSTQMTAERALVWRCITHLNQR